MRSMNFLYASANVLQKVTPLNSRPSSNETIKLKRIPQNHIKCSFFVVDIQLYRNISRIPYVES